MCFARFASNYLSLFDICGNNKNSVFCNSWQTVTNSLICLKLPVAVIRVFPFHLLEPLGRRDVDLGLVAVGLIVRTRHDVVNVVHDDGLVRATALPVAVCKRENKLFSWLGKQRLWWEPWSSGYGRRLVFLRSRVRIPVAYTGWTCTAVEIVILFVWKDRK